MIDLKEACAFAELAAIKAGEYIAAQHTRDIAIEKKIQNDGLAAQIVTEVDRQSEAIIVTALKPFTDKHGLGFLGEESGDDGSRFEKDYFWCVDPLDGTLAFINGHAGSSVAIALVSRAGVALLGVVYDIDTSNIYSGIFGKGARLNNNVLSIKVGSSLIWMQDRSNREHPDYKNIKKQIEKIVQGWGEDLRRHNNNAGAVMNACWAIEQSRSVYFKFPKAKAGGGSLWDYAASACIFSEAGGFVSDVMGKPLELNRKESTFLNHQGVVFCTDKIWLEALKRITKVLT